MIIFTKDVAAQSNRIQAPLLVMHSTDDHVLPPQTVDHLIATASSKEKHLIMLQDSYHYALVDYDAPRIVEQSLYFVKGIDPDRYAQPIEEKQKRKRRRYFSTQKTRKQLFPGFLCIYCCLINAICVISPSASQSITN